MKVGDKLYSKKSFNGDWIVKGRVYYVLDIIYDTIHGNVCGYFMSSKIDYRSGYSFSLDRNEIYLWDYFYTEKELRKHKLNQINKEV